MKEESTAEEQEKEELSEEELNEETVEAEEKEALEGEEEGFLEEVEEQEEIEGEEEVAPAEEVEPLPREEVEEEIVEERFYTIPLRKAWIAPSKKRAPRAMGIIRDFVKRHMKLRDLGELELVEEEPKRLVISNEVNERVWRRGIKKPPRKVRVRAARDIEGNVTVYLAEGE